MGVHTSLSCKSSLLCLQKVDKSYRSVYYNGKCFIIFSAQAPGNHFPSSSEFCDVDEAIGAPGLYIKHFEPYRLETQPIGSQFCSLFGRDDFPGMAGDAVSSMDRRCL